MVYKKQLLSLFLLFSVLSNNVHADGEQAPVVITEANFEQEMLESKIPVLLYSYDVDSALHKTFLPLFTKICPEFTGQLKFAIMNIDENYDVVDKLNIMGESLLLMHKGQEYGYYQYFGNVLTKTSLRLACRNTLKNLKQYDQQHADHDDEDEDFE